MFKFWEKLLKELILTNLLKDKFDICRYWAFKVSDYYINKPLIEVVRRTENI